MLTMKHVGWILAVLIGVTPIARAEITGSFEGQWSGKKLSQPLNVAAVLVQAGKIVTGTLALGTAGAPLAGNYTLTGKATPKKVTLSGFGPGGARLSWSGKIVGDTVSGKGGAKGAGQRLAGVLAMTRNPALGDGTGCDAVFNQNMPLFVDHVMAQVLSTCTACHVPGGQAGSTRFHVTTTDPLATARSIAPLVDASNPTASRILQKPLQVLPHGGGQQIAAGSAEEQTLTQWINLLAQAHCN